MRRIELFYVDGKSFAVSAVNILPVGMIGVSFYARHIGHLVIDVGDYKGGDAHFFAVIVGIKTPLEFFAFPVVRYNMFGAACGTRKLDAA